MQDLTIFRICKASRNHFQDMLKHSRSCNPNPNEFDFQLSRKNIIISCKVVKYCLCEFIYTLSVILSHLL